MITNIRNARIKDAPEIAGIEKECFSSPWSEESVLNEIRSDDSVFLIAKFNKDLVGYISAKKILGEVYVNNLAVKKAFRRNGIGTVLLNSLISFSESENCSLITLEVRVSNSAARKLYESFGFRPLGERKNFYTLPVEDAVIYTLYLKEENK